VRLRSLAWHSVVKRLIQDIPIQWPTEFDMYVCKSPRLGAVAKPPLLLLIAILACTARPSLGQAENTCDEELSAAETNYIEGQFDEAIRLTLTCLNRSEIDTTHAISGYRLLALALIRKDELPEARAAIVQLFDVYPEYEPDPVTDPPSYTALVDIVRQQILPTAEASEPPPQRSWFRSNLRWLLSGGAVVAGGVLAAVLMQGGDSPSPSLPPPPPVPN